MTNISLLTDYLNNLWADYLANLRDRQLIILLSSETGILHFASRLFAKDSSQDDIEDGSLRPRPAPPRTLGPQPEKERER